MTKHAEEIADRIGAVIFDTGGTVFDWHSGVAAALARIGSEADYDADWPALTKEWRRLSTGMVNVEAGTLRIGDGGTSGFVASDIVNAGTVEFARSDDVLHTYSISGSGGVVKTGTGAVVLMT